MFCPILDVFNFLGKSRALLIRGVVGAIVRLLMWAHATHRYDIPTHHVQLLWRLIARAAQKERLSTVGKSEGSERIASLDGVVLECGLESCGRANAQGKTFVFVRVAHDDLHLRFSRRRLGGRRSRSPRRGGTTPIVSYLVHVVHHVTGLSTDKRPHHLRAHTQGECIVDALTDSTQITTKLALTHMLIFVREFGQKEGGHRLRRSHGLHCLHQDWQVEVIKRRVMAFFCAQLDNFFDGYVLLQEA